MASISPSDEVVTEYISYGALARHVEGFARKVPDFADELATLIDSALADRDQVSLRARGWRRKHSAHTTVDPMRLAILPRQQYAAATAEVEPAKQIEIELGHLVDASQGRLIASSSEVRLSVYAPRAALKTVELNEVVAGVSEVSPTTDRWVATIPRPSGAVRIRVVSASGDVFDETITLSTIGPS
jgi:hypothetical protein